MSISVIMPTARSDYSIIGQPNLHYLEPTIKSLGEQTFRDFELIVVDALHGERSVLDLGVVNFPVKHVPVHPDHRFWLDRGRWGVAGTLNTGLLHAEGELVTRVDDCCEFDPKYLERVWEEYQSDGWLFAMHIRYLGGKPARLNEEYKETGYELLYSESANEGEKEEVLERLYGKGGLVRDSRFRFVEEAGGRLKARYDWSYGYSSFPLEAALRVNGFDEKFDGDKSLEDMDFGSRMTMAGYEDKFILDVGHQVVEHEHMPIPESLIARGQKPIKCNYALFNLNRIDKSWRANCKGLNEKQLDYIREVSLDQPCSPTPNFYLGDCTGELWDLWAANPPVFDLMEERLDV